MSPKLLSPSSVPCCPADWLPLCCFVGFVLLLCGLCAQPSPCLQCFRQGFAKSLSQMLCQCTSTCQWTSPNHPFMLSFGTFLPNVSVSHVQPKPISFITECKYWCSVVYNKLLLSPFLCESCLPKETTPVPLLTLSLCLWMSRFSPGCLPLTPRLFPTPIAPLLLSTTDFWRSKRCLALIHSP